jgi:hypothetical protein
MLKAVFLVLTLAVCTVTTDEQDAADCRFCHEGLSPHCDERSRRTRIGQDLL